MTPTSPPHRRVISSCHFLQEHRSGPWRTSAARVVTERRRHQTPGQVVPSRVRRGKNKKKKQKKNGKKRKPAVALLPSLTPWSSFRCVALSLRQPLPLLQERAYGCRALVSLHNKSARACRDAQTCAEPCAAQPRQEAGGRERQSKSIPLGEASRAVSTKAQLCCRLIMTS